ncbi:MAG: ribosome small subunit-dependent GTPase A [Clostridiaceae bacterium]|nr:ribosome small subunit-dependent GTPase A [Clostridiaceae bacterium]MBW4858687.1 ribosome small subunit-dependent GTPase A [Clostridiaceae bacterium]MBW4868146.1 ribosome small subunit-dependent GTPase A [Clostridiaceae bacterium]
MVEGIIIKGIGGFYYVKTDTGIYECRARGVFRENKITPLIGDRVKIRENNLDMTGYVEEIMERKTELIRPPVANVTQAVIVMGVKSPSLNLWLLDRFLVLAEEQKLNVVILINKIDLDNNSIAKNIYKTYSSMGYKVILSSCTLNKGVDILKEVLKDEVTVFAGPSGVGKSSVLNKVQPNLKLKTGEISEKTKRGKHTTRHVELIELDVGGYVLDTPGFSSLKLDFIETENELQHYFKDIRKYSDHCKFNSCLHVKEPDCEVKKQLELGNISEERYNNYLNFLDEVKRNTRRY